MRVKEKERRTAILRKEDPAKQRIILNKTARGVKGRVCEGKSRETLRKKRIEASKKAR
jgi:hypothetical protein